MKINIAEYFILSIGYVFVLIVFSLHMVYNCSTLSWAGYEGSSIFRCGTVRRKKKKPEANLTFFYGEVTHGEESGQRVPKYRVYLVVLSGRTKRARVAPHDIIVLGEQSKKLLPSKRFGRL